MDAHPRRGVERKREKDLKSLEKRWASNSFQVVRKRIAAGKVAAELNELATSRDMALRQMRRWRVRYLRMRGDRQQRVCGELVYAMPGPLRPEAQDRGAEDARESGRSVGRG